jgi:hypothetical protein
MKKILSYFIIGAIALGATSCKKILDINDNPNQPTSTTPELVLPAGIVGTASVANGYNTSFAYPGGFWANVYGFGGYGATVTLNYGTSDFAGPFQSSYDNLQDYQYIIDNTSDAGHVFANSIARIMKSYVYAKLVDNYNDVPYTEALKGVAVLTPKYDKAADIYMDLVNQLNTAITAITEGQARPFESAPLKVLGPADPMFGGSGTFDNHFANMDQWKRFANSIKLRLLVKMTDAPETVAFAATQFASFNTTLGLITDDAVVQPGYTKQGGRLSPVYNSLAADENNNRRVTSVLPTIYAYGFYDNGKLSDEGRGSVIYRSYPNTQRNQLGEDNLTEDVIPPTGSTAFYTGSDFDHPGLGAVKGPAQAQPLMLLAEAKFLLAEAIVKGKLTGSAESAFKAGITASFRYLYKNQTGVVDGSKSSLVPVDASGIAANGESAAYLDYLDQNPDSYLVDFKQAAGQAQQIEAIITQKYIALNEIAMDEAFAEYRRTSYPINVAGSSDPLYNMASKQSRATSPDKLITRVPYPQSEYNVNSGNVPQNINIFSAKVFWDIN